MDILFTFLAEPAYVLNMKCLAGACSALFDNLVFGQVVLSDPVFFGGLLERKSKGGPLIFGE